MITQDEFAKQFTNFKSVESVESFQFKKKLLPTSSMEYEEGQEIRI